MKCSKCGKEIIEGTRFCTGCGTPVAAMQTTEETAPVKQNNEEIESENNSKVDTQEVAKQDKKTSKKKSSVEPWMVVVIVISIVLIIAAAIIGLVAFDIISIPGLTSGKSSTRDIDYRDEEETDFEDEEDIDKKDDENLKDSNDDSSALEEADEDAKDNSADATVDEAPIEETALEDDASNEEEGNTGKLAKVEKQETKKPLYSEEELLRLAEIYYICNGGMVRDDRRVLSIDSVDGNIYTLQVYDDMEDHTATLEWYYIDITTGKGENFSGDAVDFTEYENYELDEILADYYVIPDSDSRKLDTSDLDGLTEEQIKIARNEIYARHGRMFRNMELQNYFDSMNWYVGIYQPDEFKDSWLNEYENYNKDFIAKYEKKKGYNQ